jgi:hypothetical protein
MTAVVARMVRHARKNYDRHLPRMHGAQLLPSKSMVLGEPGKYEKLLDTMADVI